MIYVIKSYKQVINIIVDNVDNILWINQVYNSSKRIVYKNYVIMRWKCGY